MSDEEYQPFGKEWRKDMMKLPKKVIVDMYRKSCIHRELEKEGN